MKKGHMYLNTLVSIESVKRASILSYVLIILPVVLFVISTHNLSETIVLTMTSEESFKIEVEEGSSGTSMTIGRTSPGEE